MTEKKSPPACLKCGTPAPKTTLLPCLHKGEEKYICVRCLPMLIHGEM